MLTFKVITLSQHHSCVQHYENKSIGGMICLVHNAFHIMPCTQLGTYLNILIVKSKHMCYVVCMQQNQIFWCRSLYCFQSVNIKGVDKTEWMYRLISIFVAHITKPAFSSTDIKWSEHYASREVTGETASIGMLVRASADHQSITVWDK